MVELEDQRKKLVAQRARKHGRFSLKRVDWRVRWVVKGEETQKGEK